jgi:eukaryotic-like serine/threonine-protein kinase
MSTAIPRASTSPFSYSARVVVPIPVQALPPGFLINSRYEVISTLGRGPMSVVYEVRDHHQNEISALKFIFAPVHVGWNEAQVLTGLRGEFILPVRNAELASGIPFIVTVVAPTTVATRMRQGAVDVDQAVQWIRQASRGLARIHDVKLLHNDIKPDNLFVNEQGTVLVGDLGAACVRDDTTGKGHFAGTPETMAPEVAAVGATVPQANWPAHQPASIASDVYSLGATLYWLLAGKPPFTVPGNGIATMQAVVAGPPPRIRDVAPHVPQALADRVERAMARNPADRYPTVAALDAALGNMPNVIRHWNRIPTHTGHTACFVGTGHGSDLNVCAVPTGTRTQHQIEIRHAASGRRVNPWPLAATQRELPRALRSAFRDNA